MILPALASCTTILSVLFTLIIGIALLDDISSIIIPSHSILEVVFIAVFFTSSNHLYIEEPHHLLIDFDITFEVVFFHT